MATLRPRIVEMVWEDLKPRDILTRASFDNAITVRWRWAARPTRSST
jgi:dihydroxyacid dehydratase/phosphogluconate dehydratase